jgi:hypothetical protein
VARGVNDDDPATEKSRKPLKNNEIKKRRNPRQNSSKLVKTCLKALILLETQKPYVSLPKRI